MHSWEKGWKMVQKCKWTEIDWICRLQHLHTFHTQKHSSFLHYYLLVLLETQMTQTINPLWTTGMNTWRAANIFMLLIALGMTYFARPETEHEITCAVRPTLHPNASPLTSNVTNKTWHCLTAFLTLVNIGFTRHRRMDEKGKEKRRFGFRLLVDNTWSWFCGKQR